MLNIEQLSYSVHKKKILDVENLQFSPGILYGILGENGSGKTTFLKTIAGIHRAETGCVFWNGNDLLNQSRNLISQTVSLVPQNPRIYFDFTVFDLVSMGLYCRKKSISAQSKSTRIEKALKQVDAWHLKDRLTTKISSGELQRVFIARSLVTESPILLLDEPTASLDIRHQLEIWELLGHLKEQKKVMIAAIHDLHFAERFCDEIAVFSQGKCVAQGKFDQIMQNTFLEKVFKIRRNSSVYKNLER